MMCSPSMRFLGMLSWFITALASINIGLCAMFGWDFFKTNFMTMTMPGLMMPFHLIIGLAGLWSFCLMIMAFTGKECPSCGSCKK